MAGKPGPTATQMDCWCVCRCDSADFYLQSDFADELRKTLLLCLFSRACVADVYFLRPLLAGRGVQYSYQFYKLLLTVSSVHAFWFAIGLEALASYSIIPRSYAYALAILLAVANGFFTLSITDASAKVSTVATSHRAGAHLLIDPIFAASGICWAQPGIVMSSRCGLITSFTRAHIERAGLIISRGITGFEP